MESYSLTHLDDQGIDLGLAEAVATERPAIARVLAFVAESDERKRYVPAAYPSMHSYCVHHLHFSEDAAYKRIQAARIARVFPRIFHEVAAGRLHLTGVGLLAPHLTRENADELLNAAAHNSKAQIRQFLAERFPSSDSLTLVAGPPQLAPAQVGNGTLNSDGRAEAQLAPAQVRPTPPRSTDKPVATGRYDMSFTVDQEFHDELAYATALLGEQVGTGDSPAVLKRALKALIRELEKTKFAATSRPRDGRKIGDPGHRYIPPAVKREVWARDGGQCTFVSESGQRCHARKDLEFDHMDAVALGGCAVAGRMRLLCRTHNQYEAERTFGAGFMLRKRADATAERRAARSLRRSTPEQGTKVIPDHVAEVVPWLRSLGFRAEEALNAAMRCESMADAALEDRIKAALARSNSTRPPVVAA